MFIFLILLLLFSSPALAQTPTPSPVPLTKEQVAERMKNCMKNAEAFKACKEKYK